MHAQFFHKNNLNKYSNSKKTLQGASDGEKEIASGVAPLVAPDTEAEAVQEGEEPDEFWEALGGRGEYSTEVDLDK